MIIFDATEETVTALCPVDSRISQVTGVGSSAYLDWMSGTLIQDAFPDLTDEEREILITGLCRECQDSVFTDTEEW